MGGMRRGILSGAPSMFTKKALLDYYKIMGKL